MAFLLVVAPGFVVFLIGLAYGLAYAIRYKRSSLGAMRLRQTGLALFLLSAAGYFAYRILRGDADPLAWLVVATLVMFGLLHLLVVRGLHISPR